MSWKENSVYGVSKLEMKWKVGHGLNLNKREMLLRDSIQRPRVVEVGWMMRGIIWWATPCRHHPAVEGREVWQCGCAGDLTLASRAVPTSGRLTGVAYFVALWRLNSQVQACESCGH